mmetsp:Transcript_2216/g.5253  ORF Transcript_2216/g.5253 Transcript_2216/m.5253 type:complete len:210 (-) Transcript_2216:1484-2113(-)
MRCHRIVVADVKSYGLVLLPLPPLPFAPGLFPSFPPPFALPPTSFSLAEVPLAVLVLIDALLPPPSAALSLSAEELCVWHGSALCSMDRFSGDGTCTRGCGANCDFCQMLMFSPLAVYSFSAGVKPNAGCCVAVAAPPAAVPAAPAVAAVAFPPVTRFIFIGGTTGATFLLPVSCAAPGVFQATLADATGAALAFPTAGGFRPTAGWTV